MVFSSVETFDGQAAGEGQRGDAGGREAEAGEEEEEAGGGRRRGPLGFGRGRSRGGGGKRGDLSASPSLTHGNVFQKPTNENKNKLPYLDQVCLK